ncbi:gluconate 2-dehydrogenase subunit 3 family protein [Halostella sp. JP-L12]|uniref:gluconate 2-dehydrogenase subunit 3 family protein n=1 Tax=Halostella TaxID=1843185 RepID=UPI000EF78FD8|nr:MULTISPECIES: gluconate 2-dehydrogenase subunit 3 family protein [Halostella]NHN46535.1 gluconate 2-dehydrogenase subunit 3 family protein [Halostella sp. JP-L12]
MELTRRDALIALFGGTGATAVVGGGADLLNQPADASIEDVHVDRLQAVAAVLYPSAVDATQEFVETYVLGRITDRESYRQGVVDALTEIESASQRRHGQSVTALSESNVDGLLRAMGVATAYPVPDGTIPEQVRYYVVNDLLYALYTTPVGGRLVGYENPDGYPGGTDAYQRGPDA